MEEPRFIESGQRLIAGFSFFGDPFRQAAGWDEDNEIGCLWKRWLDYFQRNSGQIPHLLHPEIMFEIHIDHEGTREKGIFEIFTGVEVRSLEGLPTNVLVKVLPPVTYAVFTLQGEAITGDWGREIYQQWLPASPYETCGSYQIQQYDARFLGMDRIAESTLEILVPVRRRSSGNAG
jgi:predicted transcriptional regulator YdeE